MADTMSAAARARSEAGDPGQRGGGARAAVPDAWAGRGFSRPGPGAEVPRDLYLAALEDALAYATDRDGCGDCDPGRLCEAHAARAARAREYQRALERELEAGA